MRRWRIAGQASLFSRSGSGAEPPGRRRHLPIKFSFFLSASRFPRGPGAGFGVAGFEHVPDELGVLSKALRRSRNGLEEEGVHGFDEELFAVVGDKRQLRKR